MPSLSPGYSALKRWGEQLMRQAERDPRLARAVEQGYDLLNPVVHGTTGDRAEKLVVAPRAMYAASDPEHALLYTGGGRRGGVARAKDNGAIVPLVIKGKPKQLPYNIDARLPTDDLSWLKEFGIEDPEAFRQKVWEANVARQMAMPTTQRYLDNGMTIDEVFGNTIGVPDRGRSPEPLHHLLNAIEPALPEDAPLLSFRHPYSNYSVTPSGQVRKAKDTGIDTVILIADPSLARSPWAQFEEDGVGLMKAKGGLVQYRDCGGK